MDDITVYGLKSCDTCRKALAELDAAGKFVTFVDIRTDAHLKKKLPLWLAAAGPDRLVNKRSTTWRNMTNDEKETALTDEGAAKILCALPTLIKRPVIEDGETVHVGWAKVQKESLGLSPKL